MNQKKHVYKSDRAGKPLITTISSDCRTPWLNVKFCTMTRPFYYPNSPTVPRYSITCLVDTELHKDFLAGIKTIEENEGVQSILKDETKKEKGVPVTTGKILIKFQGKDRIPVYIRDEDGNAMPIELEDDLEAGEKVMVVYDILRYTKKNATNHEHGITFKPTCVYYLPKE